MRTIQFNSTKLLDEKKTDEKPVINIVRASLNSNDSNWSPKLSPACLTLSTTCYDSNDQMVYSSSQALILGSYINLDQTQPVVEINHTEHFKPTAGVDLSRKSYYITTISLDRIHLQANETLNVYIIDTDYIKNRINDWKSRIASLFADIQTWANNYQGYSSHAGRPTVMNEELMQTFEVPAQQINTLDIIHNGTTVLFIKPKGLWTIGANGRIDILSKKGSFMVIDSAQHFHPPLWRLYGSDTKASSVFDQQTFSNILSHIEK